jgi:hypothetical protein
VRIAERKEDRVAAARYQKQAVAEAKAAREVAKKEKEKEKKAKAERMAAAKAKKQQEREAAAAQKALRLSQKTSSTSQQEAKSKPKLKRGASQLQNGEDGSKKPSQPLQKRQELEQSGHQIDILSRPEVLHCLVYLSASKSHDNSYCGWCCSLDCAQATMWVGGPSAEPAQ